MRCKKHFSDLSSTVGVCSSCLRDRLVHLIDQQSKPPIQFQSYLTNPSPNFNRRNQQQQQPQPPPLIFPRSVSPYTRPKSEPIQRFYSTPQVNINPPKKKQNSAGKFGLISKLFRSRSISSSSSSNSKLTSQNSTLTSHNSTVITCRNKGMSPENEFEIEYEESSPASWATRPSPARVRPSPARAASMAAFCLSPLVRASPSRQWRGCEKLGFSGESRVPTTGKCKSCNGSSEGNSSISSISSNNNNKPHLSNAATFCANRSRKLADFGRLNPNR